MATLIHIIAPALALLLGLAVVAASRSPRSMPGDDNGFCYPPR